GGERPNLSLEFCAGCHDSKMAWQLRSRHARGGIPFPHAKHAAAVECLECHAGTASDAAGDGKPFLTFDRCIACHDRNGIEIAGGNCAACHAKDMRRTSPADHDAAWTFQHGPAAGWRVFDRHGKDCSTCHRSDACVSCHAKVRPRTHTSLWRLRTHGFAASYDEESCRTCHEQSACVRCHKETEPMSHRGAWKKLHGTAAGGQSAQHCAVCHGSNDCASCHR
ncbi:MAG: hypothetical protein FJ109_19540, partial [Deltaproteobacteria bacterium]|nr:hypothetical protein [Deltaproteobacteria bacterium]